MRKGYDYRNSGSLLYSQNAYCQNARHRNGTGNYSFTRVRKTPVGSTNLPVPMKNVSPNWAKSDNNGHFDRVFAAQNGTRCGTETAQRKGRRTETDRTDDIEASLPTGIRIGRWSDERAKPFYVRYGKDRTVESFASEQDRNDRAENLAGAREEHGKSILDVELTELREWREFRRRCPATLDELEALWRKSQTVEAMKLAEASKRYIALWTGKEPSFSHVRLHLKRLTEKFGSLALDKVSPDLLRDFCDQLKHPKTGKPMSEITRHDHRKNWEAFFQRCVLERWLQFNPCDLFTLPVPAETERDILTARQIFDLLKANRNQPVIGRMAFELFGGLRASSAARMSAEHVKRDARGLRMPGSEHKSGKTKFRQGHQDVLWAWFDHAHPAMWEVTKGSYDERKRDAFTRAHVANPGNVLRNSFATYMLALTNNPPLVARLMQHTSLKMLEIYEGVATEADAKLVMAMTPDAVKLSWEKFITA